MARLAGIERITVSESIAVRVLILKREQDEGEQLLVHKLDESIRGRRDPDGSQHSDIMELQPTTFGRLNTRA